MKRFPRWISRLLRLCLVLLILAAVAVGAGMLWLRHAMQAQLPQIDGDRRTIAVMAPVTVERDHQGVPHLSAESVDDLVAAQGYVAAQDRLWQMDMMRRSAAGELAEILGSKLVDHDRAQRVLQFRPTAERLTASLAPEDRRIFEDYARGVNAYIHEADALPAEFRMLGYKPRPWHPVDSLLISLTMVQMLDEQWPTKLAREQIEHKLGPTLAADLYPTGSWRDHPPMQAVPDLTQPPANVPPPPPDEESRDGIADDLLRLRAALGHTALGDEAPCRGCIPGSNEWARQRSTHRQRPAAAVERHAPQPSGAGHLV